MTVEEKRLYHKLKYQRRSGSNLSDPDLLIYRKLHRQAEYERLHKQSKEEHESYLERRRTKEAEKILKMSEIEKIEYLEKRRNAVRKCRSSKSTEELLQFEVRRYNKRRKRNQESLKVAYNHKQPWTEAEIEFLIQNRDAFTVEQLALQLGRTNFSVHSKLCALNVRKGSCS